MCVYVEVVCRTIGFGLCMERRYVFYGRSIGSDWIRLDDSRVASTRARERGRHGIDDDGWERQTKTR